MLTRREEEKKAVFAMDLSERKRQILKAVIEQYIATAEPVGSKLLAAATGGAVSSATIRNEMSELEEMGYLEKPHTSAGRAPTPLGYRLYVDELMNRCYATALEIEQIRRQLESRMQELDQTMERASAILSELTGQPAVSLSARRAPRQVRRLELIPIQEGEYALVAVTHPPGVHNTVARLSAPLAQGEGEAFCQAANLLLQRGEGLSGLESAAVPGSPLAELIASAADFVDGLQRRPDSYDMVVQGAARLLGNPEFYDAHKARALLEFLSDKNKVFALTQDRQDHKPQMLNIRIGPENGQGAMEEASFIFTAYDLGEDTSGVIGVIGPTRMDYSKIASRLLLLSRGLQGLMPIRFPEEEPGEDDNR